MPAAAHDLNVAFADVVVPGQEIDLSDWQCWTERDRGVIHHYARGPCPACHAPIQGHVAENTNPIESLGRPAGAEPPPAPSGPVEIPVRCVCGYDHGHPDARSCGRRWSILCHRESR